MDIPSYLLFTILVVITTIQYSGSQGEVTGDVNRDTCMASPDCLIFVMKGSHTIHVYNHSYKVITVECIHHSVCNRQSCLYASVLLCT